MWRLNRRGEKVTDGWNNRVPHLIWRFDTRVLQNDRKRGWNIPPTTLMCFFCLVLSISSSTPSYSYLPSPRSHVFLLTPQVILLIYPSHLLLSFNSSLHLFSCSFWAIWGCSARSIHLLRSILFSVPYLSAHAPSLSASIGSPSLHCSLPPPLPCSHIDWLSHQSVFWQLQSHLHLFTLHPLFSSVFLMSVCVVPTHCSDCSQSHYPDEQASMKGKA